MAATTGVVNEAYIEFLTWKEDGRTVHSPGSNFYIEPDGTHVEGEFQASKLDASPFARAVLMKRYVAMTPAAAKRAGRKVHPFRQDWERVKVGVMSDLVRAKFREHEECAEWLESTGNLLIVESNWWCDNFWGNCRCIKCHKIGKNWLGKILMDVRAELRGQTVRQPQ